MTHSAENLRARIIDFFNSDDPEAIGVAVSGGSDSLALLKLLTEWRDAGGPKVLAVTVNHRLRPEASVEADQVARHCRDWGVPHQTLVWEGGQAQGNISDQARRARYNLISDWAKAQGLTVVALGHTLDDQAETFLMRLSRSAGVDGLAAMAPWRVHQEIAFARPLLKARRDDLQAYLREIGLDWVSDPTNADPNYARTRARSSLAALAPLGIDGETLADVASHLADVKTTLYNLVSHAAREIASIQDGDLLIEENGLARLEPEIARRLMQAALRWVNRSDYPPRGEAMGRLMQAQEPMTLQGCYISRSGSHLRVAREAQAAAGQIAPVDELWDKRWILRGPGTAGLRIKALGQDGLIQCPERSESPLPASSLRASPAVWDGEVLVAAPLAGMGNGWKAEIKTPDPRDIAAVFLH